MPKYRIQSPDGQSYEITAPDGASEQDVLSFAHAQWSQKKAPAPAEKFDPTEGNGFFKNVAIGAGKAVVDTGRGLRQLAAKVGVGDQDAIQQEIDDAAKRDAPLMDTGGGITGNILGNVATTVLPAGAVLRGGQALSKAGNLVKLGSGMERLGRAVAMPASYTAAAGTGAAMGAVQPVTTEDEEFGRLKNILMGGAGGAAGTALGRGIAATARGAKALIEPFYESGREKIVGRTLNRAAGAAGAAVENMRTAGELVPGSLPTMGEAAGDAGLASLQLAASADPAVKAALAKRAIENNAARVAALQDIAGDAGKREFFDASRRTTAKELYDTALAEQPTLTPWIKGQLTDLERRPAFQQAVKDAKVRALNEGVKLDENNVTQVVHYAKMELDDAISKARTSGGDAKGLMATKDKLVSLIESKDFAPSYRVARDTYAEMSEPLNQMDVGQHLLDKMRPALMDMAEGAPTRLNANAYAQAMRDAAGTVKRATGRNGTLENVMSPEQMASLTGIGRDLARKAAGEDMAKTAGSTTAQNMTTRNIMRQVLGPTGLPESWAESTMLDTMMKPAKLIYGGEGGAESRTRETLVKALLDAGYGAKLMSSTSSALRLSPEELAKRQQLVQLLMSAQNYGGATVPLALNARQQ